MAKKSSKKGTKNQRLVRAVAGNKFRILIKDRENDKIKNHYQK